MCGSGTPRWAKVQALEPRVPLARLPLVQGRWEAGRRTWAAGGSLQFPKPSLTQSTGLLPAASRWAGQGLLTPFYRKGSGGPGRRHGLLSQGSTQAAGTSSRGLPRWSPHLPPPPATLASTLSLQLPRPTAIYSFVLSLSFLIRKSGVKMMTCAPPTFPPRALFPCLSPVQMLRH